MGLDQYRMVTSPFDRYYEEFLRNSFRGKHYRIVLADGDTATGVPTSGSIVDAADLEGTKFHFRDDRGAHYQIPFRDLKEATELP